MTFTSQQSKICLVIVFNHRYDQNLDKLERLYAGRFKDIVFLVPFYDGDRANVIPVYESSCAYEGFIAQAYGRLAGHDCTHYVIVADDMLINPRLNESNIIDELGLVPNDSYIKSLMPLYEKAFGWWHRRLLELSKFADTSYLKCMGELPSYQEAAARLARHGVVNSELDLMGVLTGRQALLGKSRVRSAVKLLLSKAYLYKKLPYPLAMAYSDFLVVPASAAKVFSHYCGVFAAMNVFVEIAIPTALALACQHIVFEKETRYHGVEYWDATELERFLESGHHELSALEAKMGSDWLYVHPVKLSRLKMESL
jgi:hypothetical protein